MQTIISIFKQIVKATTQVIGVILIGLLWVGFCIGPLLITQNETLIIAWVIFYLLLSLYLFIIIKIASEHTEIINWREKFKVAVPEAHKLIFKILIGGIVVCFIILLGSSDSSTGNTPQSDTANNTFVPTTATKVAEINKIVFYANAKSNVRSCASVTCDVLKQVDVNTPITLEYQNTNSMPEWVPISWSEGTIQKNGYVNKMVLASYPIYAAPPTYTPSYQSNSGYKYNSRTGYSGNYGYNYDVSGSGDNGYTYGNIDTSGKYGEGYIYDEEGNEIYVETEWVDNGVMEATDEYGNTYELEVD